MTYVETRNERCPEGRARGIAASAVQAGDSIGHSVAAQCGRATTRAEAQTRAMPSGTPAARRVNRASVSIAAALKRGRSFLVSTSEREQIQKAKGEGAEAWAAGTRGQSTRAALDGDPLASTTRELAGNTDRDPVPAHHLRRPGTLSTDVRSTSVQLRAYPRAERSRPRAASFLVRS